MSEQREGKEIPPGKCCLSKAFLIEVAFEQMWETLDRFFLLLDSV